MTLYDFIIKSAWTALSLQNPGGFMHSGHNGPYYDPETPVRNTAHWLITFIKAYQLTGDTDFFEAAEKALNYLTSQKARPMDATFWIRKNPEKDFSNGLVGQAWVIEALIAAAKTFSREDLIELANEIFLLHPYDKLRGGWRVVNVDGSYSSLDFTFNHQLWFAAAGGLITQVIDTKFHLELIDFLNRLNKHLDLYSSGLIRHKSLTFLSPKIEKQVRNVVASLRNGKSSDYMQKKSIGYHGFNLYAFGLLHHVFPEHPFWTGRKFQKALDYVESDSFRNSIFSSKYGYPYNPPGFEIPFAMQVFARSDQRTIQKWVESQIKFSYDKERNLLCRNTSDPNTMAARLYEATRLDDIPLNIDL